MESECMPSAGPVESECTIIINNNIVIVIDYCYCCCYLYSCYLAWILSQSALRLILDSLWVSSTARYCSRWLLWCSMILSNSVICSLCSSTLTWWNSFMSDPHVCATWKAASLLSIRSMAALACQQVTQPNGFSLESARTSLAHRAVQVLWKQKQ